ncbi:MAG: hypothetical protein IT355_15180 [Gemmatimonadaceae bacterium]|nr:hypothetical protein [Gemmatimonadaceae bacterium]
MPLLLRTAAFLLWTGFAIHDLTQAGFDPAAQLGAGYVARTEPARLTMLCAECAGAPMLDVRLGRQDDGTEGRVRAGTTTMADLEAVCRSRSPSCRIEAVRVAPAVGWMSSYRFGEQYAHTVIVLRDGDLLTIRSLAADSVVARRNADLLVARLVPAIVGP